MVQFGVEVALQWMGCGFGVLGSLMLALNNSRSGWGFVAYLASNAAWVGFGLASGVHGLTVQHVAFSAVSGLGVWRWIVKPRMEAKRARAAPP